MRSRTKDEMFIIRAYETTIKQNDKNALMNRYEIGRLCGITEKGTDAISTLLAQANFIKKVSSVEFRLTPNGEALAIRLIEEK